MEQQYLKGGKALMNKKLDTKEVRHLFEGMQELRGTEEYFCFFEDVCTINELLAMAQRYEVAKMLREGKTYIDIAKTTGASTATISRVNRSLNYGAEGYRLAFDRLDKKKKK
jgi:TrpR family protein YerC/YecD